MKTDTDVEIDTDMETDKDMETDTEPTKSTMENIHSVLLSKGRANDAEIWYGHKRKIDLKSEILENEKLQNDCIEYMKSARKENITRLCLGSWGNYIFSEKYQFTLREFLNMENYVTGWWVKSHNRWRMKPKLQEIIKKMIIKVNAVVLKGTNFEFNQDSVVLSTYFEPLFIKPVRKSGSSTYMWKRLAKVIKVIVEPVISKYCSSSNVHDEVHEFIAMLELCKRSNCDIMLSHPALLTEQERLDFLLAVHTMFVEKEGYPFEKVKQLEYRTWHKDLANDKFGNVANSLAVWDEKKEKQKAKGISTANDTKIEYHVEYIHFIRSCFEHMERWSFEGRTYSIKRMGKDFDNVHPKFASYVFSRYVDGKNLLILTSRGYRISGSAIFSD